MKVMTDTISTFMQKHHYAPNAFTKAIYFGANARRHSELARKVGFDLKTQVQNPFFGKVGCAGTAFVPMLLVAALEEAKAADRFLVANYGDGCDVLTLQGTALVGKVTPKRAIKGHSNTKLIMPDYLEFISRWRGLVASEGARRPPNLPPSPSARRREDEANIRLHGVKCLHCGYEQFPPQRVCISCQTRDQFEKVRFADKKAKIFTFSQDYLAGTPDVPLVITVVDFQNGGRGVFMMTDRDREKEVTADAVVEMTFRKLRTTGGIHNYHWKTMPLRESIGVKEA